MHEDLADIGVIGMAVMGQNLILNMNDHGYKVVAYNRTVEKVEEFLNNQAKNTQVIGAHSAQELANKLSRPRKIMMMVKAGEAVDQTIEHLLPFLEKGDLLIDGGNSHFTDTERRLKDLNEKGILYIGTGVSGGEEGARHGPSLMPGGSYQAWPLIKDIFQSIAAKGLDDLPCCDWVGDGGAGHYVKMVHNGIEYGDMELIAESYNILIRLLGLSNDQASDVFKGWNKGLLDSYLIQITSEILKFKDEDKLPLIDKILDTAGQKGTGKWTVISASDLGQPASVIAEALFARFISSLKEDRLEASKLFNSNQIKLDLNNEEIINKIEKALYLSKIVSYAQGFMLMRSAAHEYKWQLNYSAIAQMWTGGCIIRSKFLKDIKYAFTNNPSLKNILNEDFFRNAINNYQADWREIIVLGIKNGIPLPAFSSALSFFDSYKSKTLPANLLQAQRDYFGAHTYERIDKQKGQYYHTNWTGHGGETSSSTYND